jgi:polar amino acid transport system ATP-binding protein
MSVIEIRDLRKVYGENVIFSGVSLSIGEGEVTSVIGHSGSGKSTLLRCINLLDPPTSGKIFIDGEDITAPGTDVSRLRQKMGMVFQSFNLFNHLLVIENVMLAPVKLRGLSRQEAYDKGMALLRMVGVADKALEFPADLSGGQKQRVAIARTLAMEPRIALFDEPTSALDASHTSEVLNVIRHLAQDGLTMMLVTHEMEFVRDISTRVLYMDEQGIYEDGSPEQIFEHPTRPKTRDFIQHVRSFEYRITSRSFDLYEMNAGIEQFGLRHYVTAQTVKQIQLIAEEMIFNLLFAALAANGDAEADEDIAEDIDINFSLLKEERSGRLKLFFDFASESAFSLEQGDDLAVGIVRSIAAAVSEHYADGRNLITVEL